jgi:hypothetical protein
MRSFGMVLLALGVVGFLYSSDQASKHPPLSETLTVSESLRQPGGRWQAARYASGLAGALGVLLVMFPKGR